MTEPTLREAAQRLTDKRTLMDDGFWVSQREMRYLDMALAATPPALDTEARPCAYCGSRNGETPPGAWKDDPMTGDNLSAAIAAVTDLINPRLSEVDWDAVAGMFAPPALDEELLGRTGVGRPRSSSPSSECCAPPTHANAHAIAREYAALSTGDEL